MAPYCVVQLKALYPEVVMRWNNCSCLVVLLCCFALTVLGCRREIGKVTIEAVPNHGCAPLRVQLSGTAETQAGINGAFSWTIGNGVLLRGPRLTHTFDTPGTYDISLTVTGEAQTKTRVTTIEVGEAELPGLPGLYVRHECAYRVIKEVGEKKIVQRLGKTLLKDLEQRIEGRKLSTRELFTHPLWRQEHTRTVHRVEHAQFVDLPLEHFPAFGFIVVGENVGKVSLFGILPPPEPAPTQQNQVVTRVVDSWGLENVDPKPHKLIQTRLAENIQHYIPAEKLTEGLYFIEVKREDNARRRISPIALVVSNN